MIYFKNPLQVELRKPDDKYRAVIFGITGYIIEGVVSTFIQSPNDTHDSCLYYNEAAWDIRTGQIKCFEGAFRCDVPNLSRFDLDIKDKGFIFSNE